MPAQANQKELHQQRILMRQPQCPKRHPTSGSSPSTRSPLQPKVKKGESNQARRSKSSGSNRSCPVLSCSARKRAAKNHLPSTAVAAHPDQSRQLPQLNLDRASKWFRRFQRMLVHPDSSKKKQAVPMKIIKSP